jgi:hypothetical protein
MSRIILGEARQKISGLKHENLSKNLNSHWQEAESKIANFQAEIVNLRQGIILDNLSELEKRLQNKSKENVDSTLESSNPVYISCEGKLRQYAALNFSRHLTAA